MHNSLNRRDLFKGILLTPFFKLLRLTPSVFIPECIFKRPLPSIQQVGENLPDRQFLLVKYIRHKYAPHHRPKELK
jgi:hypothetical protein